MTFDPDRYHRRSIRLPGYDYRSPGAYFVTIVCRDRAQLMNDAVFRTAAEESWLWLADRHQYVDLDAFIAMPNHIHGIIVIRDTGGGGSRTAPTTTPPKPLGRLVGAFKTTSTKRINEIRETPGLPVWQRNYYEHIIRNEIELEEIRQYILDNPSRWDDDPENVGRLANQSQPVAGA
jgi:putative transposase